MRVSHVTRRIKHMLEYNVWMASRSTCEGWLTWDERPALYTFDIIHFQANLIEYSESKFHGSYLLPLFMQAVLFTHLNSSFDGLIFIGLIFIISFVCSFFSEYPWFILVLFTHLNLSFDGLIFIISFICSFFLSQYSSSQGFVWEIQFTYVLRHVLTDTSQRMLRNNLKIKICFK